MGRHAVQAIAPGAAVALATPIVPILIAPVAFSLMAGRPELPTLLLFGVAAVLSVTALAVRLALVSRAASGRAVQLDRVVEQRDALERQLRQHAFHDPLTGLGNRALLARRLDAALAGSPGGDDAEARRRPHPFPRDRRLSMLLLDLDGFAAVNDTLGHAAGDEVLLETARRLRVAVPGAALVARTSGDEFAVLFAEPADRVVDLAGAVQLALRRPYRVAGGEASLTASIGLLDLACLAGSADALRDADLARYAAKEAGGNRVVAFDAGLRVARVVRSRLADGLRRALADGVLRLHYQPVVDLLDGRMVAVEALARWTGPDGDEVPPTRFVPIAEETGLIVPMGRWVLRRACRDGVRWHERYGIAVTVNVSARQLGEGDFVDTVLETLWETGLPAEALILEITESTMVKNGDAARSLDALRERGVRIALDDFGTGYSSLSYLAELPVDILKIDRAFTASATEATVRDWAFTRAILDLAGSLNLLAIAEGVETRQQALALRALGCPMAQGFLYSRPVPAAGIEPMLAQCNPRALAPPVPEPQRATSPSAHTPAAGPASVALC